MGVTVIIHFRLGFSSKQTIHMQHAPCISQSCNEVLEFHAVADLYKGQEAHH